MVKRYSPEEIEKIAASGKILALVMLEIVKGIKKGVKLSDLDRLAEGLIRKAGAEPAFLHYQPDGASRPYPSSICTSLDDVVVHGLPTPYELRSGDLLKLDFGVKYKGYYTDSASTLIIGKGSEKMHSLVRATKEALGKSIEKARVGNTLGDIGFEISDTAKGYGFKVAKGLTGHGIGKDLHEDPAVYNYGQKGRGIKLEPGMVLAIEPMLNAGSDEIKQLKDESWATADGSLSAHFEHTVAITEKGPRILTQ